MNPTQVVFIKELREMFRDKRVRSSAFFGPLFLVFVLLFAFGSLTETLSRPQSQRIHYVGGNSPLLEALKKADFNLIAVSNEEAGRQLVQNGKARLLLVLPAANQAAGQMQITAVFDPREQLGQISLRRVSQIIEASNKQALRLFLESKNLPAEAAEPIRITEKPIDPGPQRGAGDFVVSMLPYLVVIWAFYGGFGSASDLVAGEKEKSTLETLLISPASRSSIVLGKTLALMVICLLSSMSSVLGIAVYGLAGLPGAKTLFEGGMGLSPVNIGLILAVVAPAVAFFAALLVAVSAYAKNAREAQTYLTLLSFIVIMPAIFSQFIGFTDAANAQWVNFVPVLNTANCIRTALLGKPDMAGFAITIAVGLVLAAIALAFTVKLFQREEVLTRV
jgi:sodium transport system permease protein